MTRLNCIFGACMLLLSQIPGVATETDFKNDTSGGAFDSDISNTDLLQGLTGVGVYTVTTASYTAGQTFTVSDNSFPLGGINDGTLTQTLFAAGQLGTKLLAVPQVTFTLNTGAHPLGYDLTGITSIFGYTGGYAAELADQDFTVSYSTVLAPTVFLNLATVVYSPYQGATSQTDAAGSKNASTEVQLTNLAALGVGAVRFTFFNPPGETGVQDSVLIREIDVNGTPTAAAVPEPSTWAMLFLSLGAVAFLRRRRLARGA